MKYIIILLILVTIFVTGCYPIIEPDTIISTYNITLSVTNCSCHKVFIDGQEEYKYQDSKYRYWFHTYCSNNTYNLYAVHDSRVNVSLVQIC